MEIQITKKLATRSSRVLVVDDHPVARQGLIEFMKLQDDLIGCGEASNSAEALQAAALSNPHLIIWGFPMQNREELESLKELKRQFSHVKVLIFSHYDTGNYAEMALRAGASGYVTKAQSADEILNAIRSVLAGELYVDHDMAQHLVRQLIQASADKGAPRVEKLTERELAVVQMLGTGSGSREIATKLGLTYQTIESYRQRIRHKLGFQGAKELLHFATEWARLQNISPRV